MYNSTDRILTTHIGSLPRPPELVERLEGEDDEEPSAVVIERATERVVRRQTEVGLDLINNGEQPRSAFNWYVEDRLTGIDGESEYPVFADLADYPGYAEEALAMAREGRTVPAVTGQVEYADTGPAEAELEGLRAAMADVDADVERGFVTAASPGTLAYSFGDEYHGSYEEHLFALADAMATEYELVAGAGFDLQLDAPDLLMGAHHAWQDRSPAEFREIVRLHLEAIAEATSAVPTDRIRLHTCWGNYEGPHHRDIPLEEVLPTLYDAEIGALAIEGSGPRHRHEHALFAEYTPPADLTLIPGVIDPTTNVVEHPATVADRLERVAEAVGDPSRVVAAPDCGFDTFAGLGEVHREVVWAKLEAMVEGAALASERLG